eukprot:gene12582-26496_t
MISTYIKFIISILFLQHFSKADEFNENLYSKGTDVTELNEESFTFLQNSNIVSVVVFYAPWCPHCRHFVPTYNKIANDYHSKNISFRAVNCDTFVNICMKLKIPAFPTIHAHGFIKDNKQSKIFSSSQINELKDLLKAYKSNIQSD